MQSATKSNSQLFAVLAADLFHLTTIVDMHENVIDEQVLLEELIAAAHYISVHVVLQLIVRLDTMKSLERFAAQVALHAIRFADTAGLG